MDKHQGPNHDNIAIQTVRKEQSTEMDVEIKKVVDNMEQCKTSLQQLKSLQAKVKENVDSQRTSIEKQIEESVKKVKEEGQTLIDSLQRKEQKILDHIDEETARFQTQIQKSQDMIVTVRNTIKTSEPHDLVTKHTELTRNVKLLADNKTGTDIDTNPAVGSSLCVFKPFTFTGALGCISQIRKVRCEPLNEFGHFQIAWFVTATSSGLLVISDYDAKQVHIYSQQKNGQYKKQSSLTLSSKNTTKNPYGVAVMADGKYLVARWTHVEVYSPSRTYEGALDAKYDDEMCARERGINNVKMMPDGRVLLGDYKNSLLLILKESIRPRTIKTQIGATRVTIMSRGRVALCNWIENKVHVLDIESGGKLNAFNIPNATALCYHDSTDSLLVGRCLGWEDPKRGIPKSGSGVLEQYCATTGGFVGRLATGLYTPHDMTFTPSGELVLADAKTVKVFKIQEI